MGRKTPVKRSREIALVVVALALLGSVLSCTEDKRAGAENSDLSAIAEKHDKGWKWAEKGKIKLAVQCQELKDPKEREGCEAYVMFVSAQSATSP
jgi:hypothetical protein